MFWERITFLNNNFSKLNILLNIKIVKRATEANV